MMRLGMTNPPYILEHLEEMAKLLNHPRVYSFLHVPVQSGSDSVLMDMRREYCQADFRQVVNFLRERVPDVTIATDVICGFPTETAEDFEETLQLVRDYRFPSLFINQFFARPGTPAAKMPKVPTQQVKRRTKLISELFNSYTPYDHKVGLQQKVLVTETSHDGNYYVGHNKSYDQVLVPRDDNLLGKAVDVVITSAGKHFMMCQVIHGGTQSIEVPAPLAKGQISGLSLVPPVSQAESVMATIGGHPAWLMVTLSAVILAVVARIAHIFFV
jgi:threonylcarbamoyladenosine tRNA methylthiotransferase CDKAL1